MRRINLYDFVELGKALQGIAELNENSESIIGMIKADALRKLLVKVERGDYVDFDLLGQNIQKIRESFEKIDARWNEKGEGGNHGSCLGRLLPYYAQEAVKSFENVLAAECRAAATYYVSQVGVYSTNDLIENSSARFSEETQKIIGVDALGQFQEAAQCLCYQLYTACGFHMMRAVEYVLLNYMRTICGRKFSSLTTNWGSYVAALEEINKGRSRKKPRSETIDLIRQMKNNHRNPVMHAEFVLSDKEAQDIFQLGSVVISHLAQEIELIITANEKNVSNMTQKMVA